MERREENTGTGRAIDLITSVMKELEDENKKLKLDLSMKCQLLEESSKTVQVLTSQVNSYKEQKPLKNVQEENDVFRNRISALEGELDINKAALKKFSEERAEFTAALLKIGANLDPSFKLASDSEIMTPERGLWKLVELYKKRIQASVADLVQVAGSWLTTPEENIVVEVKPVTPINSPPAQQVSQNGTRQGGVYVITKDDTNGEPRPSIVVSTQSSSISVSPECSQQKEDQESPPGSGNDSKGNGNDEDRRRVSTSSTRKIRRKSQRKSITSTHSSPRSKLTRRAKKVNTAPTPVPVTPKTKRGAEDTSSVTTPMPRHVGRPLSTSSPKQSHSTSTPTPPPPVAITKPQSVSNVKSEGVGILPLLQHKKDRTDGRGIMHFCTCGKEFFTEDSLQGHLRYYLPKKKLHCPITVKGKVCGVEFQLTTDLNEHCNTSHKLKTNFMRCHCCDEVFSNRSELFQHHVQFHRVDLTSDDSPEPSSASMVNQSGDT